MKQRRRTRKAEEPWGGEREALDQARDVVKVPAGGWIRAVREWRGTRQKDLAARMGTQRQAWAQLELSEQRDAISLYSLRKAAGALGCDVVYYLVPRRQEDARSAAFANSPGQTGDSALADEPINHGKPSAPAAGWIDDALRTELL